MIYYVHKLNVSPRPCAKRELNEANASDMKSTPFISSGCIAVPPLPSLPQEDFIFHISLPLFDRSFTTFASNKVSKKKLSPRLQVSVVGSWCLKKCLVSPAICRPSIRAAQECAPNLERRRPVQVQKCGETDAERGELHKCRTDTMTRERREKTRNDHRAMHARL